jgi:formate hydrogenlyase transcriptional activator
MSVGDLTPSEMALVDATVALTARLDVRQTCRAMLDIAERLFAARSSWILLHDPRTNELVTAEFRGPGADAYANVRVPCDRGIVGVAFGRRETVFVPDTQDEDRWYDAARVKAAGLRTVFTVPLVYETKAIGVVGIDSTLFSADRPPSGADIARLRAIAAIAAAGIRNAHRLEAIEQDRERLRTLLDERRQLRTQVEHLRDEVRAAHGPQALVGESSIFKAVLAQVDLVAPSDSTVLLVGETGTGKELIARALHGGSRRARQPFVAVNCAALPDALVESELFGFEKGAFTGAVARKAGKFEMAERGTLFLDEIGDLPLQAQAKLLRVLQEREVQRIGGTTAIPVNVRLVAATNQNLEARMRVGEFRPDLFYRLSVFPMRLPALRERADDIPLLVQFFLERFAARQHKPVPRIGPGILPRLMAYDWPGNVRELQNVVERAVILARGPVVPDDAFVLRPALGQPVAIAPDPVTDTATSRPSTPDSASSSSNVVPFRDAERHAILSALSLTGWRVSGDTGAAKMLGLKPTTLHAKMKRLGIRRPAPHLSGNGGRLDSMP